MKSCIENNFGAEICVCIGKVNHSSCVTVLSGTHRHHDPIFHEEGLAASSRNSWINTGSNIHGLIQRKVSICSDSVCSQQKCLSSHPSSQNLLTVDNKAREYGATSLLRSYKLFRSACGRENRTRARYCK